MKYCKQCRKRLTKNQKSFCSKICSGRYNSSYAKIANTKPKIAKICPECGKKFEVRPSSKNQIYCSLSCSAKNTGTKPKIERVCEICHKHFFVHPSRFNPNRYRPKYCSIECRQKGESQKTHNSKQIDTSKLSPTILSYIAGIIDGEGTVGYRRTGKKKMRLIVQVQIANTCPLLKKWLSEKLNIGATYWHIDKKPIARKKQWTYIVSSAFGCYQLLTLIEPYLIIKQKKAQEVIKFLQDRYHFN